MAWNATGDAEVATEGCFAVPEEWVREGVGEDEKIYTNHIVYSIVPHSVNHLCVVGIGEKSVRNN